MSLSNPNNLQLPDHIDPAKLQAVVDHWARGKCPLKAQDFIDASHASGVQVDLMLAQAIQESCIGTVGRRPIETKNMFDVGNVDNGTNHVMADWHTGLAAYCHLMATSYGKTAEAVCGSGFTNIRNGGKYASDPHYVTAIWAFVLAIRKMLAT